VTGETQVTIGAPPERRSWRPGFDDDFEAP